METKNKNSFLADTPSWALAIFTVIGATLVLFGLGEGVSKLIKIDENIGGILSYLIFDVLIAIGCYFIVKQNPRSIWYVLLICNAIGILAAIIEPTFWKTSLWMLICGGWVLSLFASIIGARSGRKTNSIK